MQRRKQEIDASVGESMQPLCCVAAHEDSIAPNSKRVLRFDGDGYLHVKIVADASSVRTDSESARPVVVGTALRATAIFLS